ncbi:MAG: polysaccharide biosynthesis/export family protein [Prolixibacteraceae bacterium]|jgi:polysaccharide export outer membrane protein
MKFNKPKFEIEKLLILSLIIPFLAMLSCRSSKDLIYLRDAGNSEIIHGFPSEYTLKTGDILYVSIKSMSPEVNALFNPESSMDGTNGQAYMKYSTPSGAYLYGWELDAEGSFSLPMLGKIKVAGKTVPQTEDIVQKKADEYLKDAIVKVKLLNFKITVAGEVKGPGDYYIYNNSITVLEALAMANGNTDYASIKKIMVVRPVPEGERTYLIDLSSKKAYLSEAFYLQPNDYVFVQPDRLKNFQLNSQAYSLFFSSLSLMLAVLGFVIK